MVSIEETLQQQQFQQLQQLSASTMNSADMSGSNNSNLHFHPMLAVLSALGSNANTPGAANLSNAHQASAAALANQSAMAVPNSRNLSGSIFIVPSLSIPYQTVPMQYLFNFGGGNVLNADSSNMSYSLPLSQMTQLQNDLGGNIGSGLDVGSSLDLKLEDRMDPGLMSSSPDIMKKAQQNKRTGDPMSSLILKRERTENRRENTQSIPNLPHLKGKCHVDGCKSDLSGLSSYYQRYRTCMNHLKAPYILKDGCAQRFCQQCGRFHDVREFDGNKRSCRARLQSHNVRRRKKTEDTQESLNNGMGGGNMGGGLNGGGLGGLGGGQGMNGMGDDHSTSAAAASVSAHAHAQHVASILHKSAAQLGPDVSSFIPINVPGGVPMSTLLQQGGYLAAAGGGGMKNGGGGGGGTGMGIRPGDLDIMDPRH